MRRMPIPFFSSSVPSPSPVIAPPMSYPFPSPPLFILPVSLAKESGLLPTLPGEKTKARCKNWSGPNTYGPCYLRSWRGRVPRVPRGDCAHYRQTCSSQYSALVYAAAATDVLPVVKSVKAALPWERGIVRLQLATTSVYPNVVNDSPQQSAYLPCSILFRECQSSVDSTVFSFVQNRQLPSNLVNGQELTIWSVQKLAAACGRPAW